MLHRRAMIPIAIVGMSTLLPDAVDTASFWRNTLSGRDCMREVPPSHWLVEDYFDPNPAVPDKTYAKRGAFLPAVPFDPLAFGIPPNMLPSTDSAQLLALLVAKRVLDDASRGQFDKMNPERISVVLGATGAQELMVEMGARLQRPVWAQALRELGYGEDDVQNVCSRIESLYVPFVESTFPGLLGNVIAGRIANRFNLGGTNCVTDAACASALAALTMGLQELELGHSDLVITGGVDTMNDPSMFLCFSKTPALSATGDCRPFSVDADGTMLGEGLVMFALKRLEDAERDNDRIYAVIRGIGTSSDGRALSVYAPRPEGQAKALRRAYEAAGYGPETVELVEAHGTGTKAGDAAEFSALARVFDETNRTTRQWCALGSVKSQIGHTKSTAGAAGMAKAVLGLCHKVLPPTIKVAKPNPQLEVEKTPFYLNVQARPWIRAKDHPRRASVSAFGFGGSNFHVTLEEYSGPAERAGRIWTSPSELVLLGADTGMALAASCRSVVGALTDDTNINAVARRMQAAFSAKSPARLALVVTDAQDLRRKLEQAAQKLEQQPDTPFAMPNGIFAGFGVRQASTAFLFPGQGSQYIDMGADVAKAFEYACSSWDDAAASITFENEGPLHQVVFPRPAFDDETRVIDSAKLTATEWAQPAIGAASVALLRLLQALRFEADVFGGHSFGELTALHAARAFDMDTFLRTARKRGEFMRDAAATPGAMTAIARPVEEVVATLAEAGIHVGIANDNGPKQTVLSDTVEAIEAAEKVLQEKGFELRRLSVATAFHSPVVAAAKDSFLSFLQTIEMARPAKPVYSNVDAAPHADEIATIRSRLADQIVSQVRFAQMIEAMYHHGVRTFVEVGPGSVLSNLVGQILGERASSATVVNLDRKGQHGLTAFWTALGRLAIAGHDLHFDALWKGYALEPERPAPRPKFAVDINGANHGRPYPERKLDASKRPPAPVQAKPIVAKPMEAVPPIPQKPPIAAPTAVTAPAVVTPPRISSPNPVPRALPSVAPTTPITKAPVAKVPTMNNDALRSLSDAHVAMQRALSEGHANYLRVMESSFANLCVAMGAPVASVTPVVLAPAMAPVQAAPALPAPVQVAPALPAPVMAPAAVMAMPPAPKPMATAIASPPVAPAPIAAPPASAPAPAPIAKSAGPDIHTTLIDIVAEKTGYPKEMLEPTMSLEGDLGIDSIKRVEILSALRERVPALPTLTPSSIASLRTLEQIVGHLKSMTGGAPAVAPPTTSAPAPSAPTKNAGTIAAPTVRKAEVAPMTRAVVMEVGAPVPMETAANKPTRIAVTDDGQGLRALVVERLRSAGIDAHAVDTVTADDNAVVFLGGLRQVTSPESAFDIAHEAFAIARTIAPRANTRGGLFVTVQDTGGDFGLSGRAGERAWFSGLAGLAKTAALEWPEASIKAIDIERNGRPADDLATAIVQELLAGGPEIEVGLHADGQRTTLAPISSPAGTGAFQLRPKSVVVVSGGARGVTVATLQELARTVPLRIVLLGRTPLEDEPPCVKGIDGDAAIKRALLADAQQRNVAVSPTEVGRRAERVLAAREARAAMTSLEKLGSEVQYIAVDVRDAAAVEAALVDVRRTWGPIHAVIHAAGVLADKVLAEKTEEQFKRVFETKVKGLYSLLNATRSDDLALLCVFSSVAARTGNIGQSDYALSNEIISRVIAAERVRRGNHCVVRALGWGPWDGGMVTPSLRSHFEARGIPLISLEAGARAFVRELSAGSAGDTEVVLGASLEGEGKTLASLQREFVVAPATLPFLESHRVAGRVVLPAVLALEWFIQTAQQLFPTQNVLRCFDLRVLKGVILAWHERGERFQVVCRNMERHGETMTLGFDLVGEGNVRHYSARVELAPLTSPPSAPTEMPLVDHRLHDADRAKAVYSRSLFHGAHFQVLQALGSVTETGLSGTLRGARELGWTNHSAPIDGALVDGGLQMAIVWAHERLGYRSLPTKFESFRLFQPGWVDGDVLTNLRVHAQDSLRTSSTITWLRQDGQPIATLEGLEMHAVANQTVHS